MGEIENDFTAQYEAEMEAQDVEVAPGVVFVVRGINRLDWGRIYGVVPVLPGKKAEPGSPEEEKQKADRGLEMQRAVYEDEVVVGLRNPETGEIGRKPAFEKVRFAHLTKIVDFATGTGELTTPKAAQIARSLRE